MTSIIAPNPFPIVSVVAADREALYGGLISAAHPIAYARRMADTLPDSDGSLQMLARYRLANASPEFGRLTARVAEVVEEDGGCWHTCSGCQESNEGYVSERDYPYSPLFKCQPGGGCHECGGIGVLWSDGAFLASYGDALSEDPTPTFPAGLVAGQRIVPQAWIDRAMQIEAAADGLVSMVNDAIQRAEEGTGRLYAANRSQLDKWVTETLEAIDIPEPALPLAAAPKQAEQQGVEIARLREALAAEDDYWAASRAHASAFARLRAQTQAVFDAASRRRDAARAALNAPTGAVHRNG